MEALRFADFVLDLRTRRLTREAQELGIGSRDAIIEAGRPAAVLGANNLHMQITTSRPMVGGDQ